MFKAFTLAALLLTTPAVAQTEKQPCSLATRAEFLTIVEKQTKVILAAKPSALVKIMRKINAPRVAAGKYELEADEMLIGILQNSTTKETKIGFVFFYNGCVVPGGIGTLDAEAFAIFMQEAGVSFEDFQKEMSASS